MNSAGIPLIGFVGKTLIRADYDYQQRYLAKYPNGCWWEMLLAREETSQTCPIAVVRDRQRGHNSGHGLV